MLQTFKKTASIKKQAGAAVLFMAIVILTLITLVVIFTARTINLEIKTTANLSRSQQALEAAEAGVNWALEYYAGGNLYCTRNTNDLLSADPELCDLNTENDPLVMTATSNDSPSFYVAIENGNIESTGFSDDKSARRTIWVEIGNADPLGEKPDNPFTARGQIEVGGSVTIYNPEGHTTIWSGKQTFNVTGSPSTYVADPSKTGSDAGDYPQCMDSSLNCSMVASSNKDAVGLDVVEYDASLANLSEDAFFENYFGVTKESYRDNRVTMDLSPDEFAGVIDNAASEVIWVEGDLDYSNTGSIGCEETGVVNGIGADSSTYLPSKSGGSADAFNACVTNSQDPAYAAGPSILIVNGDMEIGSGASIFGLLFVTGNLTVSGTPSVFGAAVVGGEAIMQGGGSFDVWYSSELLGALEDIGNYGLVEGTWRDFD